MFFPQSALDLLKSAFIKKEFLHISAGLPEDRLLDRMGWQDINQMMRENRLTAPRLRLCKNGQTIPKGDYTCQHTLRRGTTIRTIVEEKFYALLRDDATLVIDSIDQLHRPLDDFCAHLEKKFQTALQVNAYMSWGEARGFDTHWDDHDVIILQVEGRKNWFLFGETRKYPLYTDLHSKENTAPTDCVWNEIIQKGDILFIPRGHWHHAVALQEPSLHLTFGFAANTGLQVIDWLKEKSVAHEAVRQDVPFLESSEECTIYWTTLKNTLLNVLSDTSLEDFVKECRAKTTPRQRFSLPEAVLKTSVLSKDFHFQWHVPWIEGYGIDPASGNLTFKTGGKVYQFAGVAKPLFDLLITRQSQNLGQLCQQFSATLSETQIKTLVSDLLLRGLIQGVYADSKTDWEADTLRWGT